MYQQGPEIQETKLLKTTCIRLVAYTDWFFFFHLSSNQDRGAGIPGILTQTPPWINCYEVKCWLGKAKLRKGLERLDPAGQDATFILTNKSLIPQSSIVKSLSVFWLVPVSRLPNTGWSSVWARSHSHRQPAGSCPALERRSLTIKKSFWSHDYRAISGTATTGTDRRKKRKKKSVAQERRRPCMKMSIKPHD